MLDSERKPERSLIQSKFFALLISLLLALLVSPVFRDFQRGGLTEAIQLLCLTFVAATSLYANRQRKRIFRFGLLLAAIVLPVAWTTLVFETAEISVARFGLTIVFLFYIAGLILISIIRDYEATMDALLGSICVYLLLGFAWASVYSALEYIERDPLFIPHRLVDHTTEDGVELTAFSQLVYFSFVTMSTLGYGEIHPTTPLSRAATWLQSVVGQFYLAILVARLVNSLPRSERSG